MLDKLRLGYKPLMDILIKNTQKILSLSIIRNRHLVTIFNFLITSYHLFKVPTKVVLYSQQH
jgi:hypothetical protein